MTRPLTAAVTKKGQLPFPVLGESDQHSRHCLSFTQCVTNTSRPLQAGPGNPHNGISNPEVYGQYHCSYYQLLHLLTINIC
jgi:hypothetical protein